MDFVVSSTPADTVSLPTVLASLPAIPSTAGAPTKTFEFTSQMGSHVINGRSFGMERVDAQVSLGVPELWRFVNNSGLPHPVHMHAGQFRVLSRSGGRGQVFPWERGLKDTVLLMPFESVEVAVHFQLHRGLYLLHCHNLEHEDAGMMLNFQVV
jgi:FtsP/CotA-like multicopper oxidase with cupredoxin domain